MGRILDRCRAIELQIQVCAAMVLIFAILTNARASRGSGPRWSTDGNPARGPPPNGLVFRRRRCVVPIDPPVKRPQHLLLQCQTIQSSLNLLLREPLLKVSPIRCFIAVSRRISHGMKWAFWRWIPAPSDRSRQAGLSQMSRAPRLPNSKANTAGTTWFDEDLKHAPDRHISQGRAHYPLMPLRQSLIGILVEAFIALVYVHFHPGCLAVQ